MPAAVGSSGSDSGPLRAQPGVRDADQGAAGRKACHASTPPSVSKNCSPNSCVAPPTARPGLRTDDEAASMGQIVSIAVIPRTVPWPAARPAPADGWRSHRVGHVHRGGGCVGMAKGCVLGMPIKLPFGGRRQSHPTDLWTQCPSCQENARQQAARQEPGRVCTRCGHHFRLRVDARIAVLLDRDLFREQDAGLELVDMLGFVDQKPYPERLEAARISTGSVTRCSGASARCPARRSRCASWISRSWAAQWAPSSARRSPASSSAALAERLSADHRFRRPVARACRRGHSLADATREDRGGARPLPSGRALHRLLSNPTTGGVVASFACWGTS